ncbi:hypothetical protein AgCh_020667 [Apium graveolens]
MAAFKRGDDVEIISQEKGFEGSFYEAVIISKVSDNDYIVQYTTLVKEDDSSAPLRAFIPGDEIRPVPEDSTPENGFQVKQMVDVYYNDGWWTGKITGKVGNKYRVRFEHPKDRGVYSPTHIRIHRDWINGEWV